MIGRMQRPRGLYAAMLWAGAILATATASLLHAAEPEPGLKILRTACGGCHVQSAPDHFARISEIRKTPEGWLMTIFRMQHVHKVDLTPSDRDTLVRYLADTQGLAPSEALPARYALERRPNVPDRALPGDLQALCARCHSAARVALQRRDADDWLKHVHWHLAQWPTIEYQQGARDRLWWQQASTEVPVQLGKLFPFHTSAWDDWQRRPRADLGGTWLVHGHEPGRGDFWGSARITRSSDGQYQASYSLDSATGAPLTGDSTAIVYTGYEWRGTATLGGRELREVYALSEDGQTLSGRWFEAQHPEVGADWHAVRTSAAGIVSISPAAVRRGSTSRVTLLGSGLTGRVDFGPGIRTRVLARTPYSLAVELRIDSNAAAGYRLVSVGAARAARQFAVFDRVDRLGVTPAYAIARLGGGRIEPVAAQFEATAYRDVAGANGVTEPVSLGVLPVTWSVDPYNDDARLAQDVRFAGEIDASGRFHPAGAGPNPQRKFSGNNAGNLWVTATLAGEPAADRPVTARGHLIVTVQRWNTPPIY